MRCAFRSQPLLGHRQCWRLGINGLHVSSTYQAILEEGAALGEIRHARRTILRLGSQRFGPPGVSTMVVIESLQVIELLDGIIHRLLTATSWEDLLSGVER